MAGSSDQPRIPTAPAGIAENGDAGAEQEAASFSTGMSPDELAAAAAAAAATGAPRIPPLSIDERVAAASSNDGRARAEEESLSSYLTAQELQQRARQMEADRHQRFKDEFENVAIIVLHLGTIAIGILAVVWAMHLVLPAKMRWLSAEDLTHIQTLLTAGVLVGAVGGHFKKRFSEQSGEG